jgi:hypothetical protein
MPIDGMFTLIFAAYNAFFGVRSQDDQVRCFAGIAEHLSESGAFVIEVFVPDLTFSIVGNKSACSKSKRTAFTSTLSSTIRFDRV